MAEQISFPFPFSPYDVQQEFMTKLYNVLENSEIGIFESPTGTGKSMSIICGSLKWLKDFQEREKQELQAILADEVDSTEDNWFDSFLQKQEKNYKAQDAKKQYNFLMEYEDKIQKLKDAAKSRNVQVLKTTQPSVKRMKVADAGDPLPDDDFMIDDKVDADEEAEADKTEKQHVLKIYYASRTHSQLAQFLGEIQKSPYRDQVTVTTLGSRANFCINQAVSKLRNLSLINEQCTELQRKKGKKCQYMKNLSDMEDSILSSVRDIEDIVQLGKQLHSCPYYATRHVIPNAQLVLLPYNVLLHKPTREAYGITLKNNILIIDEAHNLVEAVNSMYSAEISGILLQQTFWQIDSYFRCYKTRFSRENLRFIKLLLSTSKCLIDYLKNTCDSKSQIMSVSDFINLTDVGNINMFELVKYLEHSLIGQKIHGFTAAKVAKGITPADDQNKIAVSVKNQSTSSFLAQIKEMQANIDKPKAVEVKSENNSQFKPSAIFNFIEFLKTLTFPTDDGRILIHKANSIEQSSLKFLHLNPSSHFHDIVAEARSIVLAGGTMKPVSEFTEQLFLPAGVPSSKISLFSCGHVIPPENLLAMGLDTGPCGNRLDFTYKSRQLPEAVKELGSILLNISTAVRGGVVCFFPSYGYEDFIYSELTKSKVLQSIEKRYRVFREPKLSSDVDRVLGAYAKCIASANSGKASDKTGALLFSIVGGKMSEGINFSDDLGRCVVMVGLPYPNKTSVELKEKMAYLNQHSSLSSVKSAGDVYYNNLCMKAVNQSIGRAIRHRNDYACILLLDYRYNLSSVKDSLPVWISRSLSYHVKFGSAYMELRKFFASKNKI